MLISSSKNQMVRQDSFEKVPETKGNACTEICITGTDLLLWTEQVQRIPVNYFPPLFCMVAKSNELKDARGRPLRNAEVSDPQRFSCTVWKKVMPTESKDRECIKEDI